MLKVTFVYIFYISLFIAYIKTIITVVLSYKKGYDYHINFILLIK